MVTLHNEFLDVSVSENGAELTSIRTAEREYLWQADPEFWGRHSPVLFPIVGNLYGKKCKVNGVEYGMGQHGFARDSAFQSVSEKADEVWFCLDSSGESKKKFPFDFRLEIGYRLHEKCVDVMWRVVNTSKEEVLPFQIGAHPAFYWPEHNEAEDARGFFAFDAKGTMTSRKLIGKGCVSPTETFDVSLDDEGMLPLSADTFDVIDTIILERQVHSVALCDINRKPLLALHFDAPVVGLWSPPGRRAPFVCIEPWYGRCDTYGYDGEFIQRDWVNTLKPGEQFDSVYTIEIC